MCAEIKLRHRVPITGCQNIHSLFTSCGTFLTDFLPKLSRPVMAEAFLFSLKKFKLSMNHLGREITTRIKRARVEDVCQKPIFSLLLPAEMSKDVPGTR